MKKLLLGCFLLCCCAQWSFAQEEAIKDSMEVFFKLDRANLLEESKTAINAAFEKNADRILKVRVTGHTCDLGSDNYNMGLSERRANSAFEYVKTISETYGEKAELFFYGEREQKYDEREANRRVHVLFFLEDDDRDTLITKDCAQVFVEKGTYKPTKTKKSSFELDYYTTGPAMGRANLSINDTEGRKLYFNSVVYFQAKFEGSELSAKKAVKLKMPLVNDHKEGYTFYEGVDNGGTIVWKNTGKPCALTDEANCKTYNFDWMNSGFCACAMQRKCEEDCNPDPFSGEDNPDLQAEDVRYSANKTVAKFESGTYADLAGVTVVDDNNMEEDLDVCEQFEYAITTDEWYPNMHKMDDKKNIIIKSEAAPAGGKTTRLYVPKADVEGMTNPVILVGERHSKGYAKYIDNIVEPSKCIGSVNCDYVVYDVPATGVYKLGEWDANKAKPKKEDKWILKVRLLKNSTVFVGNKATGEVYKAKNAERNGKTRPKEYVIYNANASDLVVYVQNETKPNFKLYQEAKLTDLIYKKAANMYVMRRVKFVKCQDFSEAQFTNCK